MKAKAVVLLRAGVSRLAARMVSGPDGAIALLTAAGDAGNAEALALLGTMYAYGMGVRKDRRRAFGYDVRSAAAGSATGMFHIARALVFGEGTRRDPVAARRWLRKATTAGSAEALDLSAYCYRNGVGVRRDLPKAFALSTAAAKKGVPSAMYALGVCYSKGLGAPVDEALGRTWFRKAARAGDSEAIELVRRLEQTERPIRR